MTLARSLAVLGTLLVCCAEPSAVSQARPVFHGRLLADALRSLQQDGLPIVFSSEIVTPAMRVVAEPRATTARQQLDELLLPHGLRAEPGPHAVIQIVRAAPTGGSMSQRSPRRSAANGLMVDDRGRSGAYAEQVIVKGSSSESGRPGVASDVTLTASELQAARNVLQDDPVQTVLMLPGASSADDFRSEFSARGSPYRHIGMVVDGVATPWLRHSVYGRSDAGSLSMFGSESIEAATLRTGAYPQTRDDRLGAQLELTLREGSREATHVEGFFGGTSAGVTADGPLGARKRGSWIVGVRNSYLTWPVRRHTQNGVAFAFGDAHAKLVYDVTPAQQLAVTVLAGRSMLDWREEPLTDALADGTNQAGLLSMGWRTTLGPRTVIRQRASVVGRTFLNRTLAGKNAGRGTDRAITYRGEILHAMLGGTLEAGSELRQLQGGRSLDPGLASDGLVRNDFSSAWWTRSAYGQFAHRVGPHASLAAGVRLSDSTLVHAGGLAPWVLAEWSFTPGWTLNASLGAAHQFPELDQVMRTTARSPALAPERATSADVSLQQRLSNGVRWQATFFSRVERDVLREPSGNPRLIDAALIDPLGNQRFENALSGTARGLELLLAQDSAMPLSGWISYTYGATRQTDGITHESFWSDFDRRHVFNAAGAYRVSDRTSIGVVLRGGSNVPIPGYFVARDGRLFAGGRRNDVRLPYYARLDVRAHRTFLPAKGRMTVFAEVLNVLNRQNQSPADGLIQPLTGEATGFTRALVGRRASAGVVVGFGGGSAPGPERR